MNILIVAYYFSNWKGGGAERIITEMGEYMRAAGHNVTVAVPSEARTADLERASLEYVRVGDLSKFTPIAFFASIAKLRSTIKKRTIDIVTILTFRVLLHAYIAVRLAAFNRKIHIVPIVAMQWKDGYSYIAPFLSIFSDKVITYTRFCERRLRQAPFMAKKVVTIPNFVDTGRFKDPFEKKEGRAARRDNGAQVIGTVSRLVHQKGVHYFLQAAELVLKKHDAQFWVVGDGQQEGELKSLARDLGIESHVSFLGHANDIPRALEEMDIFVFLSSGEGMPASLLEAMAAGLPVVTTDVHGNSEVVVDGITGLLVPFSDTRKTAEAIETFLVDRDKARAMGEAGRERAVREFDTDIVLSKVVNLFGELSSK